MATFNIQHSYTRISLDSSITEATSKANGKWEARKTGRKEYVESSPSVIGTFSVSEHSDSSAGCELRVLLGRFPKPPVHGVQRCCSKVDPMRFGML